MKSKTTLMTILLSFIIIFSTSCNKQKEPIRIAINGWPSCELWYIAEDQGYFDDLPVKIVRFTKWTDSLAAFYQGKVDVVHSTYFNTVYYAGKGENSKIILMTETIFGNQGLVAKTELQDLAELKGKKIAVETYTDEHFLLHNFLKKLGMTEEDVTIVATSSFQEASEFFISGKADAAFTYEPFVSRAINKGHGKLIIESNEDMMSTDVILARENSLDGRTEDYAKLIKAWYKAQEFVGKNPKKAYKIMASKENITADEFKKFYEKFIFFSLEENLEELSSDKIDKKLKNLKNFMTENKLINDEFDTKTLYDNSVVEKIKGEI